jgi:alpha-glucosidase (family GH31 glycosyl hydrolase)
MDAYTTLTGRQPMPARWTLGNFASRFGYHSAEEALKTVALFRAERFRWTPLCLIFLVRERSQRHDGQSGI